jgi:ATP-dependent Clp protease ATP-binding subunit ClpA
MTTNAGQAWLRDAVKSNPALREDTKNLPGMLLEESLKELAKKDFRPEFLGRVDECISFLPFSRATCRGIIDLVLTAELAKFRDMKGVTIIVDEAVRNLLAQITFDRCMDEGARAAPRAINLHVVTPAIDLLSRDESRRDEPRTLRAALGDGDRIEIVELS